MYFISAQPDELYFKWQLEVQLLNFANHNIPADKIHVLISYNPDFGVHPKFLELAQEQSGRAQFYFYEDLRVLRSYIPAARTHIIKKHFSAHPYLKENAIFYHDSDIIFRELPDFEALCKNDTWYVSDARDYIGAGYISKINDTILHEMCEQLEIDKSLIKMNDEHAGGAQYILKGVNYQFWDKVEHDSEKLFCYLRDNKDRFGEMYAKFTGNDISTYNPVQEWCADMWAVLWNGHQLGYKIEIHKELDFCWPIDEIHRWQSTKILHNSGIVSNENPRLFYKSDYNNSAPYDIRLDQFTPHKCTIKYVEAIKAYRDSTRTDLTDVTFMIPLRIDSADRLDNVLIVTAFLSKFFKTNIIVLEADVLPRLDTTKLPEGVKHIFIEDCQQNLHRTYYNNLMIKMAETPIVALYDTDVVMDPQQLLEAVDVLRNSASTIVYPYNGHFRAVDSPALKSFFGDKLDIGILKKHTSSQYSSKSFGGAVLVHRQTYMACGMENENFFKWGPEDSERVRRMEIMGHVHKRISGPLYHLHHRRGHNSNYSSEAEGTALMSEYLRICNMSKAAMEEEISTWKWCYA